MRTAGAPRVPASHRRPRLPWMMLLAGLTMITIGLIGWWSAAAATPNRGAVPTAAPTPSTVPIAGPPAPVAAPATPEQLRLPSLGVDAPVVPVDVEPGGALRVPDDPGVLGWWQAGARPGSGHGTVVVDGHVDTARDGPGAFYHLRALRPGDQVRLRTDRGTQGYVVRAVRSFPKTALPPELFTTDGPPRLALVTCGGSFDQHTRQYADNVVAYAVPG
ncbi:MAG: peptidase sortase [Pseudonocardia sp.]|nr:peptidase sortase [Pseudonocardia sp.]MDT7613111.1 hypothetical protein [Pseudonocardiales bacterium]